MRHLIARLFITYFLLLGVLASPVLAQTKILPIGDSITQGTKGATSYRKPLIDKLNAIGCEFEMVGSRTQTNAPTSPVFSSPHEGYSGHRTDNFIEATNGNPGINSIMDAEDPDIVLFHLGSNDMSRNHPIYGAYSQGGLGGTLAELEIVTNSIFAKNPNANIFVANVIPWYGSAPNNPNIGSDVTTLSGAIDTWINGSSDSRLTLIDVHTNFQQSFMLSDLIHPNADGDDFIAQQFYDSIVDSAACTDTIAPVTLITDPSAGTTVPTNYTFNGSAFDSGASGIARVRVAISENGYTNAVGNPSRWYNFDTKTFGPTYNESNAAISNQTISNLNWQFSATLPLGGEFTVYALAVDNAGNQDYNNSGVWPENVEFMVASDDQIPTASISLPANPGDIVPGSTTLTGSISDTGGAGIDSLEVAIRRLSNGGDWFDFNGGFSANISRVQATVTLNTASSGTWSLPVDLPSGSYRLQIVAFDKENNNSGWIRKVFEVAIPDSQQPSGTISTPEAAGDTLSPSVTLAGTATDAGGSGVSRVELAIRKTGANGAWYDFNGGFSDSATRKVANLNGAGTSSGTWSLPVILPAGNYRLHMVIFDGANNNSGWIKKEFDIALTDTQSPTTSITSPSSAGALLSSNSTMSGIASDTGGSGLDSVEIAIRRLGNGGGWFDFGGGFLPTITRIPVTLSTNGAWALPVTLPAGVYRLQTVVFDNANNNSGWINREFTVNTDVTDPTATYNSPVVVGAVVPSTFTLSGDASDTGGSGLASVELAIKRLDGSGTWFDFNGSFALNITRIVATLNLSGMNSGSWSAPVSLPAGDYRAQIVAFDQSGNNSGWVHRNFTVEDP